MKWSHKEEEEEVVVVVVVALFLPEGYREERMTGKKICFSSITDVMVFVEYITIVVAATVL